MRFSCFSLLYEGYRAIPSSGAAVFKASALGLPKAPRLSLRAAGYRDQRWITMVAEAVTGSSV
jgi:hypothetical protein